MSQPRTFTVNVGSAAEFFDALRTLHLNGYQWNPDGLTWLSAPFTFRADFIEQQQQPTGEQQ